MTENLQPGPHLSPDQLSAFTENVLPEHERHAALTHLSACADCRRVVFLAQQADPALTASAPAAETPRRGWFTLPQIFGAATAALACSLILALIIHQRHTDTPSAPAVTTSKIEQPPALAPPSPPPVTPSQTLPTKLSPVEPHTDARSGSSSDPALPIHAPRPSKVQMAPAPQALGAGMPSGGFTESKQRDKATYGYSAPSANTYAALPPKSPTSIASGKPLPAPPPPPPPPPESRMRQATNDSAKSKKDFSATETVTATAAAPPPDTSSEVAADTISTNSIQDLPLSGRAVVNQAAVKPSAQKPIQLPSKKPAITVLYTTGRTLALDSAGTLFLSLDLGKRWTPVTPQWSGKVVQISYAATPAHLYLQQPAQNQTQNQSNNSVNGNTTNSGLSQQQAPIPAAGFDLTTTAGAVWHSIDGITWRLR